MKELIIQIEKLKEDPINNIITMRSQEFADKQNADDNEIFKELCFCLMTANFNAEKSIKIQNAINDGFLNMSEEGLAKNLIELGHRFPNMRAKFISEAQKHKDTIKQTLTSFETDHERRDWLVENIKGLGFKESSHFLRNIGYNDLAIIDFHIVDLLVKHNLMEKPKTITKKVYLEVEKILDEISKQTGLSQGDLDLYLWYEETGKVLK